MQDYLGHIGYDSAFTSNGSGRVTMEEVSWQDFEKIELRVGTIVAVDEFPQARIPAYKLRVDFGPEIGERKSSAQITALYAADELVGKQVIGVVNFPAKQIGPMKSECLVTGFYRQDGVVLAVPEKQVPDGLRLG